MEQRRSISQQRKSLVKAMIKWVDNMRLFGSSVIIQTNNPLALSFDDYLRRYGYDKIPKEIVVAINKRICELGVQSFKQICGITPVDHVTSPEAVAFAIRHKVLNDEQIQFVEKHFDHGETLESFIQIANNFFENVTRQLTTPRVKPIRANKSYDGGCDGHCCCTC